MQDYNFGGQAGPADTEGLAYGALPADRAPAFAGAGELQPTRTVETQAPP